MCLAYSLMLFCMFNTGSRHQTSFHSHSSADSIATFYTIKSFYAEYETFIQSDTQLYVILKLTTPHKPNVTYKKSGDGIHSFYEHNDFLEFGNVKLPNLYFYNDSIILTKISFPFNFYNIPFLEQIGIVNPNIKFDKRLNSSLREHRKNRVIMIEPYHIDDHSIITQFLNEKHIEIIKTDKMQKSIMIRTAEDGILKQIAQINEVYYLHYFGYLDALPDSFLRNYVPYLCSDSRTILGYPLKYSPYSFN